MLGARRLEMPTRLDDQSRGSVAGEQVVRVGDKARSACAETGPGVARGGWAMIAVLLSLGAERRRSQVHRSWGFRRWELPSTHSECRHGLKYAEGKGTSSALMEWCSDWNRCACVRFAMPDRRSIAWTGLGMLLERSQDIVLPHAGPVAF